LNLTNFKNKFQTLTLDLNERKKFLITMSMIERVSAGDGLQLKPIC